MKDRQAETRTGRWSQVVAVGIAIATGVLLAAAVPLTALSPSTATAFTLTFGLVVCPLSAGLGVTIVRQTEGNTVGVHLGLVGLTTAAVISKEIGLRVLAERPALAESLAWLVAVTAENVGLVFAAVALLLLHFPTGRLPSPRWRIVPWLVVATAIVHVTYGAFEQVPFRSPLEALRRPFPPPAPWFDIVGPLCLFGLIALLLASGVSLVLRHRRSGVVERRQIRWIAIAGLLVAMYPVLCLVEIAVWGEPLWLSLDPPMSFRWGGLV